MLGIWLATVPTDSEAPIGATTDMVAEVNGQSVVEMLWTVKWRYVHLALSILGKNLYADLFSSNSCKSFLAAPPVMAKLLDVSKEDLAVRTRIATSNRGSDPSRPHRTWLPGSSAVGTDLGTTMAPEITEIHLRGLKTVVATTDMVVAMGHQELPPGINRLLHPHPHLLAATLAMATEGIQASHRLRLPRICQVRLLQVWVLLQLLRVWVLCTTVLLEPLHLRHLAKDLRLL